MPDLNTTLAALSEEHAGEVSALTDRANAAAVAAYRSLASAPQADRYARLRGAIVGAVEGVRVAAREMATAHVLAELRVVVATPGLPSIDMGKAPARSDVSEYVDNAVRAAQDADEAEQGIESTAWHAERIIESEAFRTYDDTRRAAEQSLAAMPDDEAETFGFNVQKKHGVRPDNRNNVAKSKTARNARDAEGLIALIGKRWDAVNDKRTCPTCARLHGEIGLLGMSFEGGENPPAHARCRCVTHLWSVGYVKGSNAMKGNQTRECKDLRIAFAFDDRAIDEDNRVIRNAVASDESIDSHGTIFRAGGWDLSRYEKNPVVLWNHMSYGGPENVIGRGDPKVDNKTKQLITDFYFPPRGENPTADMVWGQIMRKEVRGVSVGFRPKAYHFEEVKGAGEVMIFDETLLTELSIVPVPSNENTLIAMARSMYAEAELKGKRNEDSAPTAAVVEPQESNPAGAGDAAEQGRSTPNVPHQAVKESAMSDSAKVTKIPAGLAAVLGTDNEEKAIAFVNGRTLQIAKLEDEAKQAKADADEARKALDDHRNATADAAVEELIGLKIVKEDHREIAQSFARSNFVGFTEMYAEARANIAKREAPKAGLLEQVTTPKREEKPVRKPVAEHQRMHRELARKLMNEDPTCKGDWAAACQLAAVQLADKGE